MSTTKMDIEVYIANCFYLNGMLMRRFSSGAGAYYSTSDEAEQGSSVNPKAAKSLMPIQVKLSTASWEVSSKYHLYSWAQHQNLVNKDSVYLHQNVGERWKIYKHDISEHGAITQTSLFHCTGSRGRLSLRERCASSSRLRSPRSTRTSPLCYRGCCAVANKEVHIIVSTSILHISTSPCKRVLRHLFWRCVRW